MRRSTWPAWSMWLVAVALAAIGLGLPARGGPPLPVLLTYAGLGLTMSTMGALIWLRRPSNRIGWLLSWSGLLLLTWQSTGQFLLYVLVNRGDRQPLAMMVAWISAWVDALGWWLLVFVVLLFPTGQLPTRRWRWIAWLTGAGLVAGTTAEALQAGRIDPAFPIENPLGITGVARVLTLVIYTQNVLLPALLLVAALSLLGRVRWATTIERQQLKWLGYAAAMLGAVIVLGLAVPSITERWFYFVTLDVAIAAIPAAIGVAVLKYRRYDIDRIINRTLVYGLLTAVLGAIYAGAVLVFGQLFGGIGAQPPSWAVAGVTLAVAALFQPVRRRVQAAVDRRLTGAATRRSKRSRRSGLGCATRSTSTC